MHRAYYQCLEYGGGCHLPLHRGGCAVNGRRAMSVALALLLASVCAAGVASAYDAITWRSVDCGGTALATGGGYALGGTIGQFDAGTLAAGTYSLRGGFWLGGTPAWAGVDDAPSLIRAFRFFPTRPNPV